MTSNQLEYDEDSEKQITKLTKAFTTLQHYSTRRCHICHHCSSKWSHLSPRRCRFLMSIFGPPNMWQWQYVCWIFVAVTAVCQCAQYMFVFPQCAREESNQIKWMLSTLLVALLESVSPWKCSAKLDTLIGPSTAAAAQIHTHTYIYTPQRDRVKVRVRAELSSKLLLIFSIWPIMSIIMQISGAL